MTAHSDKALRSFFGAREGGKDREQTVNTPPAVIEAIGKLWPEGIALDPAHGGNSCVGARVVCDGVVSDGLAVEWPDFTFCNPPFKHLKQWMPKCVRYSEHMMLVPVRTNRSWWIDKAKDTTMICWLRPVRFVGHAQTFPAPLAMLYYGVRVSEFCRAFRELGRFSCLI